MKLTSLNEAPPHGAAPVGPAPFGEARKTMPHAGPLLDLGNAFDADFCRRPFVLRHRLAGHSLFDLPRLAQLAVSLPPASVEYNAGDLPISVDPLQTPQTGLSIEETVRRIEQCRSWMVLKNVEQDPVYRDLLLDCLREVEKRGYDRCGVVGNREAFVFISSPGAVTPYHIDPEWNFLLQVRGQKGFTVYPDDRDIVSHEELERFYSGAHRNLVFRPEYDRKAMRVELTPGDGVHVPVTCPHWVKVGNEVSISFSITFQTRASDRRATLYALNHRQRARGGTPTPIGLAPWRDSLRYNWHRLGRRLQRLVRIGGAQAAAPTGMKMRM